MAQHQSRCGRKGSRDRFVVEMVSGGGEEARKALKHTYLVISLLTADFPVYVFLCLSVALLDSNVRLLFRRHHSGAKRNKLGHLDGIAISRSAKFTVREPGHSE